MLKMRILLGSTIAFVFSASVAADAAALGPDAALCSSNGGPAMLVRVNGLKHRGGKLRLRTFLGSDRASWFDKKMALKRTEIDLPDAGPIEICMPVPRAGGYVVDLRHDTNNDGKTDRADGAGSSGNPEISLFSFMLGSKPPASKVVVQAGNGVTPVSITVKYLQGGSFKPMQVAGR